MAAARLDFAELPWLPVGVTYAALPIGSAITLLFVVERMLFGSQAHRPAVAIADPGTPTSEASA